MPHRFHLVAEAVAAGLTTALRQLKDLIRKGRDLEKLVLARAVRLHLENRILTYGNKTAVFELAKEHFHVRHCRLPG
jgi:hypothetical protein